MNTEEMAEKIFEAVVGYGPGCSFVDIVNHCGDEAAGDCWVTFPDRPNTVLWADVSEKFIDAFNVIKSKVLPQLSSELIYLMDGKFLMLPIAKRPSPNLDYTKPHWLPVVFAVREAAMPTKEERKLIGRRLNEIPATA